MCRIGLLFVIIASIINMTNATPLDDYVNTPDPAFTWKLIQTYPSSTYTVYVLNMTSQKWFDGISEEIKTIFFNQITLFLASFSSQSIWWHYMIITVPKILKRPRNAFMLIAGGQNTDP